MTKSQHIMSLYDGKRTPAEIARIVGCRPEYVRVVARQRKGASRSVNDLRYLESDLGRSTTAKHARRTMPKRSAYHRLRNQILAASGDLEQARRAARQAYAAARRQGSAWRQAQRVANRARHAVLKRTGDLAAASRAGRKAYALQSPLPEAAE